MLQFNNTSSLVSLYSWWRNREYWDYSWSDCGIDTGSSGGGSTGTLHIVEAMVIQSGPLFLCNLMKIVLIPSCRSRQKDEPLLKSKRGLYNVRHIKDPELIELERRVSPPQNPEQSLRTPPARPESKTQR